jgi:hypothetical protein
MPMSNRADSRQGRDDRVAKAQDPNRNCDLERKVLKEGGPSTRIRRAARRLPSHDIAIVAPP